MPKRLNTTEFARRLERARKTTGNPYGIRGTEAIPSGTRGFGLITRPRLPRRPRPVRRPGRVGKGRLIRLPRPTARPTRHGRVGMPVFPRPPRRRPRLPRRPRFLMQELRKKKRRKRILSPEIS